MILFDWLSSSKRWVDPDLPPKVYFNEFNPSSLNISVAIWYHPPEYWELLDFSQRVNLKIMHEFT
ncbi:conserved hypothetical protein [delta proteobacterium NaphS2]|nr:conserved hypothetical protein [delta proteobacterium NaphS2]